MKDFLNKIHKFQGLLIVLLIVTILLLWLGLKNIIELGDFWINLSAGSATLIGTLFVIDVILDHRKKLEFSEAHDTAKSDLTQLANMMVSYMAAPFKITVFNYERGDKDVEAWSTEVLGLILQDIKNRDKAKLLSGLNKDGWQHLQLDLMFIKPSLSENLLLYKEFLPPHVLGKLLKLRRTFSDFYFYFGLLYEGFIRDGKPLPDSAVKGMADDLNQYFSDLEQLFDVLKNWKND